MLYQIFAYMEKHKKVIQKNPIKYQLQYGMVNLNYLLDHILCQHIIKKHEPVTGNPPIRIFVNKIENGITFKIKTGNHREMLMPETVKSLGSTRSKITKYENGENVPHLQIT